MHLNARQLEAARAPDGPLAVAAGPGTGKTRTFAHRAAWLIQERGVAPGSILAVTFTRGAAGEMRARLEALVGRSLPDLWVETFHAAALRILRAEGYPFGPGVDFSVAAEEDKLRLLEGLAPRREAAAFLDEARRRKQRLEPFEHEYQRRLEAARLLDFDDLILLACRLFDERPEALARWRARFLHVLVDEFQDTSAAQYALLRRLAPDGAWVIGDPDQAIYGFAGDGFKPFERLKADYPGLREVALADNYRSQAVILEAARQVIRRNPAELPRELQARLERGLPVEIESHATDKQEAEMVARRIEDLLGGRASSPWTPGGRARRARPTPTPWATSPCSTASTPRPGSSSGPWSAWACPGGPSAGAGPGPRRPRSSMSTARTRPCPPATPSR